MNKCLTCGKDVKNKYCNVSCQNRHQNKYRFKNVSIKLYGELKDFNVICNKCHREFIVKEKEKLFPQKQIYYCSRFCANSRIPTKETNEKRSIALKKYYSPFEKYCPTCNNVMSYKTHSRLMASKKKNSMCVNCIIKNRIKSGFYKLMGSLGGKISVKIQSETRRSKNEIEFSNLCKNQFKNVLTNESMFNGWDADVILPDLKIAILWNGKWHYEKLTEKHSVNQVQNRDKIKIDEIIKMGYTPYIIKDMGKYNVEFVKQEFDKFVNFISQNNLIFKNQ